MKVDEILTLLKAGYTRDEITAMDAPATTSAPDPYPAPADPAPAPADPAPAPAQPEALNQFAGMLTNMFNDFGNRMQTILQNANIAASEQPPEQNADDVIASIINPPGRNKK